MTVLLIMALVAFGAWLLSDLSGELITLYLVVQLAIHLF